MIVLLMTIKNVCFGQLTADRSERLMNYDDNLHWLQDVRTLEKSKQWLAITQRLFSDVIKDSSANYCPMLVVNGVALNVPDRISDTDRKQLTTLLKFNTVKDFQTLDTLSSKLIVCKPFAGVIVVQLDDKTNKKLSRLMGAMSK